MLYNLVNNFIAKNYKFLSNEDVNNICVCIEKICQKNNLDISKISYLSHGEASLVFECEGKIIKFLPINSNVGLMKYLDDSNCLLKPLDEELVEVICGKGFKFYISVILEDKLIIDNSLSMNDALIIAQKLLHDGYTWLDIKPRNLAVDLDGNIKLIDYGELFNKKYDSDYSYHLKQFSSVYNRLYESNKKNKKGFSIFR